MFDRVMAAVYCILPKEWRGVHYGGLEHLVMFIDLDCCFDILCLSQSLKHRLMETSGSGNKVNWEQNDDPWGFGTEEPNIGYDEELFAACMRRFLYIRCYDTFEFLATLKTLRYRLQRARETHGVTAHFLMIDSIGAFYWVDRTSTSLHLESNSRKRLSLQSISETVVEEIRKLLLVHPMLVLATKATILGDTYSTNEVKRTSMKLSSNDPSNLRTVTGGPQKLSYREFMPLVWQSFVTHRILVRAADDDPASSKYQSQSIFLSEWLMPPLNSSDKFIVRDVITCICCYHFGSTHLQIFDTRNQGKKERSSRNLPGIGEEKSRRYLKILKCGSSLTWSSSRSFSKHKLVEHVACDS
ncbi:DNA repair protein XRCC2 homolog isoform X4 [Vitis riparia]|uniref:DNA repair protein XRCC2 homolog isoform X4 n=1 Tax=Vitis riparia TaxID=96939 RepID=UPI00155B1FC3|nr:DNA repair protein XRCC2 homolog isoform X4 [Vitis riparia]